MRRTLHGIGTRSCFAKTQGLGNTRRLGLFRCICNVFMHTCFISESAASCMRLVEAQKEGAVQNRCHNHCNTQICRINIESCTKITLKRTYLLEPPTLTYRCIQHTHIPCEQLINSEQSEISVGTSKVSISPCDVAGRYVVCGGNFKLCTSNSRSAVGIFSADCIVVVHAFRV